MYVQDFKGNDPRFISYFLRSLDFSSCSGKAAVPGLNWKHLHKEAVHIPATFVEQRAIAHAFGALDDKVELNRRMNATLEAMVRALFRSWFVDFDPVRAKMEGRDTGLPQDIADLFPDRLADSELGKFRRDGMLAFWTMRWNFLTAGRRVRRPIAFGTEKSFSTDRVKSRVPRIHSSIDLLGGFVVNY